MQITKEQLHWYGRYLDHKDIRYFDYSASGFEFCFTGKKAQATFITDTEAWDNEHKAVLGIFVKKLSGKSEYKPSYWNNLPLNESDVTEPVRVFLTEAENKITLFESSDSDKEETVVVKVIKISEAAFGYAGFKSLEIDGSLVSGKEEASNLKIEFIGDSITCGYGIDGIFEKDSFTTKQERADKSYAFLTSKNLNAEFNLVSWSGIGLISNYVDPSVELPLTSWLMPALWPYTDKFLSKRLGLEPEFWDINRFKADIIVINLGTNDASYVRDKEERRLLYVSTYRTFLETIHRANPSAKICCCLGVMGQLLCDSVEEAVSLFKDDFPYVKTAVVKFPQQDEKDGIGADWHPSAITQKKVADQLTKALKEL